MIGICPEIDIGQYVENSSSNNRYIPPLGTVVNRSQTPFALFEFLDDTHRLIHSKLIKLREFLELPQFPVLNHDERLTLEKICRFFDTEAKEHHLDEELHIFPILQQNNDVNVRNLANQLQIDHGWIEENWMELSPQFKAVINRNTWFEEKELQRCLEVFELLYAQHMHLEESLAYPQVKLAVTSWNPDSIGIEMTRRRKHIRQHPDLR